MSTEEILPKGQEQIDETAIEQYAQEDGALSFKLEIFEGPLELLLSLITKNKVNIYSDGKLYQLKGNERFNAVKFVQLSHRYKNILKGEGEEYLGL